MFQGPQKKNVVLSGEAMKEMAKQAKANRDERKLTVGVSVQRFPMFHEGFQTDPAVDHSCKC